MNRRGNLITFPPVVAPLAAATVSGVSEVGAMLSVTGTNAPGTIYIAVRTSGPYASTDQTLVRNGTGAAWFSNQLNAPARHFLAENLAAGTTHYVGSYVDTGAVTPVEGTSFTTSSVLPESTIGKVPVIGED